MESRTSKNTSVVEPMRTPVGAMGLSRYFAAFSQSILERYAIWEKYPWSDAIIQYLENEKQEEASQRKEQSSFFVMLQLLKIYLTNEREKEKADGKTQEADTAKLHFHMEAELRKLKNEYDRYFGILERLYREGTQMPREELSRIWAILEREAGVREGHPKYMEVSGSLEKSGIAVRPGIDARSDIVVRPGIDVRSGMDVRSDIVVRPGKDVRSGIAVKAFAISGDRAGERRITPYALGMSGIRLRRMVEGHAYIPDSKTLFQSSVERQQREFYTEIIRNHVVRETTRQAEQHLGRVLYPIEHQALKDYGEGLGGEELAFYVQGADARLYQKTAEMVLEWMADSVKEEREEEPIRKAESAHKKAETIEPDVEKEIGVLLSKLPVWISRTAAQELLRDNLRDGRKKEGNSKIGVVGFKEPQSVDGVARFQEPPSVDGGVGFQKPSSVDGSVGFQKPSSVDGVIGFQEPQSVDGVAGFQKQQSVDGVAGFQKQQSTDGTTGFQEQQPAGAVAGFQEQQLAGGTAGFPEWQATELPGHEDNLVYRMENRDLASMESRKAELEEDRGQGILDNKTPKYAKDIDQRTVESRTPRYTEDRDPRTIESSIFSYLDGRRENLQLSELWEQSSQAERRILLDRIPQVVRQAASQLEGTAEGNDGSRQEEILKTIVERIEASQGFGKVQEGEVSQDSGTVPKSGKSQEKGEVQNLEEAQSLKAIQRSGNVPKFSEQRLQEWIGVLLSELPVWISETAVRELYSENADDYRTGDGNLASQTARFPGQQPVELQDYEEHLIYRMENRDFVLMEGREVEPGEARVPGIVEDKGTKSEEARELSSPGDREVKSEEIGESISLGERELKSKEVGGQRYIEDRRSGLWEDINLKLGEGRSAESRENLQLSELWMQSSLEERRILLHRIPQAVRQAAFLWEETGQGNGGPRQEEILKTIVERIEAVQSLETIQRLETEFSNRKTPKEIGHILSELPERVSRTVAQELYNEKGSENLQLSELWEQSSQEERESLLHRIPQAVRQTTFLWEEAVMETVRRLRAEGTVRDAAQGGGLNKQLLSTALTWFGPRIQESLPAMEIRRDGVETFFQTGLELQNDWGGSLFQYVDRGENDIVYAAKASDSSAAHHDHEDMQVIQELESRLSRQEYAIRQEQIEREELQRRMKKQESRENTLGKSGNMRFTLEQGSNLSQTVLSRLKEQFRLERIRYGAD